MNPRLDLLRPYPFEQLRALLAGAAPPVSLRPIPLSIGEPRHTPPAFVAEDLVRALGESLGSYPVALGLPQLREAIARADMRDAPYRVVVCHIPLRWLDESEVDYDNEGYDSFSKMSRDEWHDALVEWGAQVVLSGHMHETAWIPASEEFPYAQLVSGGPVADVSSPEAASWVEAAADQRELVLTMRDLGGTVITEARLTPLG